MKISKELRTEFNKRFANGEQYIEYRAADYAPEDEDKLEEEHNAVIVNCDKQYDWEQRAVYNKIAPIVEYLKSRYRNKSAYKLGELLYGENGLVERLIPLQKEYNKVANRKSEFIDRLSYGTITVEDGSVDTDDLAEEGIQPGKVLVYRCGSNAPSMLAIDKSVYFIYKTEMERIKDELDEVATDYEEFVIKEAFNEKP